MGWFDVLKAPMMDVAEINRLNESNREKRLREGNKKMSAQVQAKILSEDYIREQDIAARQQSRRLAPYRASKHQGAFPTRQQKMQSRWDNAQRKQKMEQTLQAMEDEWKRVDDEKFAHLKRTVKMVLDEIKQKQAQQAQELLDSAAKQKLEEVKNALKQSGLNDLLAQVEAVENMAEGRFSE